MKCRVSHPTVAIIAGIIHMIMNTVAAIFFGENFYLANETDKNNEIKFFWFTCGSLCILSIILSISMIIGVYKKLYQLIEPYLEFGCLCVTAGAIFWVIIFTGCIWRQEHFAVLCYILVLAFMTEGVQILLLVPVVSLYQEWVPEELSKFPIMNKPLSAPEVV